MLHLKNSMHVNGGPGGGGPVGGPGTPSDPYKDAPYAKGKSLLLQPYNIVDYMKMIRNILLTILFIKKYCNYFH